MTTLAALLLAVLGAAPAGKAVPIVRHDGAGPDKVPTRLETAEDLARLCRTLEPAERVRPKGDAVERGEAEASQEASRAAALKDRYAARSAAGKVAFAPYDGPE